MNYNLIEHYSGDSFVFLAYNLAQDEKSYQTLLLQNTACGTCGETNFQKFRDTDWILENLGFFHLSEIHKLSDVLDKSKQQVYNILSKLDQNSLKLISEGSQLILTNNYCLIFDIFARFNETIKYNIAHRYQCEKALEKYSYQLSINNSSKQCFYREKNICWQKEHKSLMKQFSQTTTMIFIISLCILLLIGMILFFKIKSQKFEEERKKHALRVLTHELRTPITNLLLQIESINKRSDLLPPEFLESFLMIEGDTYRLKRLAEKSRSYLEIQNNKHLLNLNISQVLSINDFILGTLDIFNNQEIVFDLLENDESCNVDAYWISVCIRNIIENALKHGAVPIIISVVKEKFFLQISIQDNGNCKYGTIDDMISQTRNKTQNDGLGMGLSIVKNTLEAMKGSLIFKRNPTCFILSIGLNYESNINC